MANSGLSQNEAQRRLAEYGPNALPETPPEPGWRRFLRQFQSPIIYILLFALAFDIVAWASEGGQGLPLESLVIAAILIINAGLGLYQEGRAGAALEQLKAMTTPQVWVWRDGQLVHIPSPELVPGDLVRLEAGDRIPADGYLRQAQGVLVDESILTGESVPVDKGQGEELKSGTVLVRGQGALEVNATGPKSAMGQLAGMLGGIELEKTPLERRVEVFGNQVAIAVLILAVLIAVLGLSLEGLDHFQSVLLFAVALAVAAVPEGLPAVLTLTLALGVERMASRKAVVRRLSAVEALGSVTVIATDKTGTLTENQMQVRELLSDKPERALLAMVIASDAEVGLEVGDPMELALYDYAAGQGLDPKEIKNRYPRVDSRPFDSEWKFMRVTTNENGKTTSLLKGAPEVILQRCRLSSTELERWQNTAREKAAQGFRLLAVAEGDGSGEENLQFLGLIALWDPPRPEVPEAIRKAQAAGIKVVMITGDHPATARAVADAVGLPPGETVTGESLESLSDQELQQLMSRANVFARVNPEHKLRLVEALKNQGQIVAMTGDGVNDAPALKRADVGVAMGQRGSDVTREVADLILLDDNFATIVAAIEEGRSIYENIQKFIRFLFATNLSEILVIVLGYVGAFALGLRDQAGAILLPLTAAQILWMNLITDGLPAVVLGLDKNPKMMDVPPRNPNAPLLDRLSLAFVLFAGVAKGAVGLLLLWILPQRGLSLEATRSAVFHVLVIGQLFYTYAARVAHEIPPNNAWVHAAVAGGIAIQLAVAFVPAVGETLAVTPVSAEGWLWISGSLIVILASVFVFTSVLRHRFLERRA